MEKQEKSNKIAIFEGKEIRRISVDEEWYYSVEDVIRVLTDSVNPKDYLNKLRQRNKALQQGYGQIVHPLPIKTRGGVQNVNCASTEGIFRIMQEIPSKKAEPFKRWLARVGKERLDEIEQPSKAIERAKGYYLTKGYSPEWIQTRTTNIEARHILTDKFKDVGITEAVHYAILTDDMYKSWSTFTSTQYKEYKGLNKGDSLRDNMTPLELAVTIFNEAATTEILENTNVEGFVETKKAIHIAGEITKEAIEQIERQTGKKVVTHKNYKELDSPEIRKELAQQSLPKGIEAKNLSNFNKNLKKAIKNKK